MEYNSILNRLEKLEKDIDILYNKVNSAAIAQAAVDEKLSSMLRTLTELKEGMQALQQQPLKRLETIIGAFISALVALIVGYFFGTKI